MLLKQVILKKNGNILKEKNICVVIQIERGINPNLFYCWDEVNGLGEWMDITQIKMVKYMPERIQRKRVKGWKMPSNTVCVTRPGKWGNPFKIGDQIRDNITGEIKTVLKDIDEVLDWYKFYLKYRNMHPIIKQELRGKNLACFCKEGQKCHADILLEIANK